MVVNGSLLRTNEMVEFESDRQVAPSAHESPPQQKVFGLSQAKIMLPPERLSMAGLY